MTLIAQLPLFQDRLNACECGFTLALGVIALVVVASGAVTSYAAVHRGLSRQRWFLIGLLPIVGYLAVRAQGPGKQRFSPVRFGKTPATYGEVACPECGRPNHRLAKRCAGCGSALPGGPEEAEARRV